MLNQPKTNNKKEIISDIIHAQYISFLNHERVDFNHPKIYKSIWFNMSGNINQANTIEIEGSNHKFTIMLHTGRIRE